jgi:hypothetical protein
MRGGRQRHIFALLRKGDNNQHKRLDSHCGPSVAGEQEIERDKEPSNHITDFRARCR